MTFNLTAIKNSSLLSLAGLAASLMIPATVAPASAAGLEFEAPSAQANPVLLDNAIASTPSVSVLLSIWLKLMKVLVPRLISILVVYQ